MSEQAVLSRCQICGVENPNEGHLEEHSAGEILELMDSFVENQSNYHAFEKHSYEPLKAFIEALKSNV